MMLFQPHNKLLKDLEKVMGKSSGVTQKAGQSCSRDIPLVLKLKIFIHKQFLSFSLFLSVDPY